jgi:transposase
VGCDRVENDRFTALRSHYGFDAFFCEPGKEGAHEKGGWKVRSAGLFVGRDGRYAVVVTDLSRFFRTVLLWLVHAAS